MVMHRCDNRIMRILLVPMMLALTASPALADDIPMVGIGLPFAPETPRPVAASHPLYHRIETGEIEGLPPTIKSSALNWIAAAKRSSVNAALRDNFDRMNMLAPDAAAGRARLAVTWKGSDTPFRIATKNEASVTLHYRLVRIDNGQVIFDREITTSAKGGGVDAGMRDNGIVRAAIAANFASAANCIDHAAFGTAPADCALVPKFSVSVERRR
jgi:hypothetical protein